MLMSITDFIKPKNAWAIAIAVALSCAVGVFLVDHGLWSRSLNETNPTINTAEAAKAAGATVAPTDPKTTLKPLEVPGAQPKPPT
jgi:hypothetical protein